MNNNELKTFLKEHEACKPAIRWVKKDNLNQAWWRCNRADWMVWLLEIFVGTKNWPTSKQVVLVVCNCICHCLKADERTEEVMPYIKLIKRWASGSGGSSSRVVNADLLSEISIPRDSWPSTRNLAYQPLIYIIKYILSKRNGSRVSGMDFLSKAICEAVDYKVAVNLENGKKRASSRTMLEDMAIIIRGSFPSVPIRRSLPTENRLIAEIDRRLV